MCIGCRTFCASDADNTDVLILKCASDAEYLTTVNLEMCIGCRTFLEKCASDAERHENVISEVCIKNQVNLVNLYYVKYVQLSQYPPQWNSF